MIKFRVPKSVAEWQHKGEHFFHMSYLGAVSYEAHGLYQIMAGVLLVVTVAGVFIAHVEH